MSGEPERIVRRNGKVRVRARVVARDFIGNASRKSFTFTLNHRGGRL